MIVEVGKRYRNRLGELCQVNYINPNKAFGCKYLILDEDGKLGFPIRSCWCSKEGKGWGGPNVDLLCEELPPVEPESKKWVWTSIDKLGIWALGGLVKERTPEFVNIESWHSFPLGYTGPAWRCYLGPTPEIKHTPIKEELWFCQFSPHGEWIQFWVPDGKYYSEEFSNCPNKHKTTTTRYV